MLTDLDYTILFTLSSACIMIIYITRPSDKEYENKEYENKDY